MWKIVEDNEDFHREIVENVECLREIGKWGFPLANRGFFC